MSKQEQTELLANYIMAEIPGYPGHSEGAGDMAVRLLKQYRRAFLEITNELGVPSENYPAPVANAYGIAMQALGSDEGGEDDLGEPFTG